MIKLSSPSRPKRRPSLFVKSITMPSRSKAPIATDMAYPPIPPQETSVRVVVFVHRSAPLASSIADQGDSRVSSKHQQPVPYGDASGGAFQRPCLFMAPLRYADCVERCPLLGVTRKTFAHTEFFS